MIVCRSRCSELKVIRPLNALLGPLGTLSTHYKSPTSALKMMVNPIMAACLPSYPFEETPQPNSSRLETTALRFSEDQLRFRALQEL